MVGEGAGSWSRGRKEVEAGRPVRRGVWSQQRGEWMRSGSVGGGSGGAMDDGRKQDAGFRCVILIFCPRPTDSHIKNTSPRSR